MVNLPICIFSLRLLRFMATTLIKINALIGEILDSAFAMQAAYLVD